MNEPRKYDLSIIGRKRFYEQIKFL